MHEQQLLLQQQQQQQHRRRQSLLTKSVQEEYLIHQVKLHPVLYDKSLKAYRKPGSTDNAWMNIADALGVKVEDCKKRWKSLRDTFNKYFRQEILAASIPGMKRKKWVYYDQMNFLRNHVELYGISETDSASDKETMMSDVGATIHFPEYVSSDQTEYLTCEDGMEGQFDDNHTEYIYEEVEDGSTTTYSIAASKQEIIDITDVGQPSNGSMIRNDNTLELTQEEVVEDVEEEEVVNAITVPLIKSSEKIVDSSQLVSITDPDERFLLSCAPVLKRLSTQKNALLKLKIQQLLYEVEFGDSAKCVEDPRNPM